MSRQPWKLSDPELVVEQGIEASFVTSASSRKTRGSMLDGRFSGKDKVRDN